MGAGLLDEVRLVAGEAAQPVDDRPPVVSIAAGRQVDGESHATGERTGFVRVDALLAAERFDGRLELQRCGRGGHDGHRGH